LSNLLATLRTSTSALDAMTEAVAITQNNVMNAGTAGYARQKVSLQALQFSPAMGYTGGVKNGALHSSRDLYIERSVRIQVGKAAAAETSTISLTKLEQALPISAGNSVPAALNRIYSAFSAWSVAPADRATKEQIITAAENVALSFRSTAQTLSDVATDNATEIRTVVDRVNRLAGRIQQFNADIRNGARNDAGIEAGIHATLEELSADVNVEVNIQDDGTYTMLLNGDTKLVIGLKQYELSVTSAAVQSHTSGRLGALIQFRDGVLADQRQQLDRLAEKVAERLGEFFTGSTAANLSVNPTLDASTLSAVDAGPPAVANGKAVKLAVLANPVAATDKLDDMSFTEFYGRIASEVGGKLSEARFDEESQVQLANQAAAFRDRISGVSLDEEAIQLVEFQRSYQANARLIAAIDDLMEIAVNIGRA